MSSADTADGSIYQWLPGRDALSLEETAIRYFEHVASADASHPGGDKPFDPKNVLWDRGSLTDAEAAEVLEVARRLNPPGSPGGDSEKLRASHRQMCQELAAAKSADARVAAFQKAEDRSTAQEKALGKSILDQLSEGTRAAVLRVIGEHREDIEVHRLDWQKIKATQPELLVTYSKRTCAGVN